MISINNKKIYNIPLLTDSIYKQGIYSTFEEFKNNSPSITNTTIKPDNKGHVKLYRQLADSSLNEITNAWGICMSGEQYALIEEQLVPVEKSGNGIIISRFQKPELRRNQAIYWRNLMNNNLQDANPFSSKQNKKATHRTLINKKEQPLATAIDIKTGDPTF